MFVLLVIRSTHGLKSKLGDSKMSMMICDICERNRDSDYVEFERHEGKDICESCFEDLEEVHPSSEFIKEYFRKKDK